MVEAGCRKWYDTSGAWFWFWFRLRFRICARFRVGSGFLFCSFSWSIFIGSGISVNVSASCNCKRTKYGYEYLLHGLFLIFQSAKIIKNPESLLSDFRDVVMHPHVFTGCQGSYIRQRMKVTWSCRCSSSRSTFLQSPAPRMIWSYRLPPIVCHWSP